MKTRNETSTCNELSTNVKVKRFVQSLKILAPKTIAIQTCVLHAINFSYNIYKEILCIFENKIIFISMGNFCEPTNLLARQDSTKLQEHFRFLLS